MFIGLWYNKLVEWISLRLVKVMISEWWYSFVMISVFCGLVMTRCPYIYGWIGFFAFLVCCVLPLFISLIVTRLNVSAVEFFGSMIPEGSPIWILPFIQYVEIISYIIRPFVTVIRPFVNVSVGIRLGVSVGWLCIGSSFYIYFFMVFLFIYEILVVFIHWFIVSEILKFSVDH
ncbi:ATP synthase F0 subunit 6 (mitochondrion) [Schistosoma mansoni]|uniref:ATPase subunit 6 n=1 Tax=Schistosoma mansoni TaxID=6183 RepID=Q9B8X7_SCHMA|nr:ATP synthase F0 subunit 6 [Schistosoma mansoni]AAG13160.2 ATPase subunit 6 [Schistosoma mansoni]|eukprot:NP_066208.2 ATP synthase F0 subunit 6 (mitochondrion) [Schistosoma mansoni]